MRMETIDLRRPGAALFVILLHVLVIALVVRASIRPAQEQVAAKEIMLQLAQPARLQHPLPAPTLRLVAPTATAPQPVVTPPPAALSPSLQGLHQFLFNCAPENLGMLTQEQRAHCAMQASAPNADETNSVRNLPSHAHDPARWQRALARKQNPVLLPCMSSAGIGVSPLTLACIGKGAIEGFGDLDRTSGYGDPPPVAVHVPNNGDPVPPYSPR